MPTIDDPTSNPDVAPDAAITETPELLSTPQVAARLRVSSRTVLTWAAAGKLPSIRTPGGHRRYPAPAIEQIGREYGLWSSPTGPHADAEPDHTAGAGKGKGMVTPHP